LLWKSASNNQYLRENQKIQGKSSMKIDTVSGTALAIAAGSIAVAGVYEKYPSHGQGPFSAS
jgi:hypothetical protein